MCGKETEPCPGSLKSTPAGPDYVLGGLTSGQLFQDDSEPAPLEVGGVSLRRQPFPVDVFSRGTILWASLLTYPSCGGPLPTHGSGVSVPPEQNRSLSVGFCGSVKLTLTKGFMAATSSRWLLSIAAEARTIN